MLKPKKCEVCGLGLHRLNRTGVCRIHMAEERVGDVPEQGDLDSWNERLFGGSFLAQQAAYNGRSYEEVRDGF